MLLFLIGYMGSGKTSTGRKLASRLGYDFVDLDVLVEEMTGMTIREIFGSLGEKVFREKESEALRKCIGLENTVVATGGGTPCHRDNMELIKSHGVSVYIRLHPDSLAHRLRQAKHERPLLKSVSNTQIADFIRKQLKEREKYYLLADYVIKGEDLDIQKIIELIK